MTTGWILVNIAIAIAVTALVAGISVLVPLRLDRSRSITGRPAAAPAARHTAPAAQRRAA